MLSCVTFTGIDEKTNLSDIISLHVKYPNTEFGVLIGSHTDKGTQPRFPSLAVVTAFRDMCMAQGIPSALHICGAYAREVMSPEGASTDLLSLCKGFTRVQINIDDEYWSKEPGVLPGVSFDSSVLHVIAFAREVVKDTTRAVILQHKGEWDTLPIPLTLQKKEGVVLEYLWDRSGGRGEDSLAQWPDPPEQWVGDPNYSVGYAGGLGPDTISRALMFINRFPQHKIWLDMEGNIRTDDWFDVGIVERVCEKSFSESPLS